MMTIYDEHIKELGFPPRENMKDIEYIKMLLKSGHHIHTRHCRYIGIGNLHSLVSSKGMKKFPFSLKRQQVIDPATGQLNPYPVDYIWMTEEQMEANYLSNKEASCKNCGAPPCLPYECGTGNTLDGCFECGYVDPKYKERPTK